MMPGILKVLKQVANDNGLVWENILSEWKSKGQWHLEVRIYVLSSPMLDLVCYY